MSRKPIVCVDMDGTCTKYEHGWQDIDVINDSPVDGLFPWLLEVNKHFDIHIFSSRSEKPEGIEAMQRWFRKYIGSGSPSNLESSSSGEEVLLFYEKETNKLILTLHFPKNKPPAHYTLDDRAERFDGHFPPVQHILDFVPWHKTPNKFPGDK